MATKGFRLCTEGEEAAEEAPAAPLGPPPVVPYVGEEKCLKVDESVLMKYIKGTWSKLDGSDVTRVKELLGEPANKAQIDAIDDAGKSALSLAASVSKPKIVDVLLSAGANPNVILGEEWTVYDSQALFRAVEGESLEAVQSIVEAGGDVNYISGRLLFKGIVKMTPLARARELGNKPIAAYLESKGGKDESADKPMAKS